MQVRQVVTGHDAKGRAVFAQDEQLDARLPLEWASGIPDRTASLRQGAPAALWRANQHDGNGIRLAIREDAASRMPASHQNTANGGTR